MNNRSVLRGSRRFAFLTMLGMLATVFCSPAYAQIRKLRVLSYNVHHCQGVDRKLDVERIARVIRSTKPDLVALQEVDRSTGRSMGVDQAARLAELTEMKFAFGKNIAFDGGEYGNAVLSRWPIAESVNHSMPNHRDGEKRGALEVKIQLSPRKSFYFVSTHFDHRSNPSERIASALRVNQLFRKYGSEVIMAGDFNDTHKSRTFGTLAAQWRSANLRPMPTIPVDEPKRQIDFVLVPKASTWRATVAVIPEKVASDHRAILAILER